MVGIGIVVVDAEINGRFIVPVLVEIVQILTVEVVVCVGDAGSAHEVPTDFGEGIRSSAFEARITGSCLWGCHGIIIAPTQGHPRVNPIKTFGRNSLLYQDLGAPRRALSPNYRPSKGLAILPFKRILPVWS